MIYAVPSALCGQTRTSRKIAFAVEGVQSDSASVAPLPCPTPTSSALKSGSPAFDQCLNPDRSNSLAAMPSMLIGSDQRYVFVSIVSMGLRAGIDVTSLGRWVGRSLCDVLVVAGVLVKIDR